MNFKAEKILKFIITFNCMCIIFMSFSGCHSTSEKDNKSEKNNSESVLAIETPTGLKVDDREIFSVDVTISELGSEIYPAMSMSIDFDASNLEFTGIEDGNVFVTGDTAEGKLPEWSVNTELSNKTGQINIMYLDTSGGRYAFTDKLIDKDKNILLRLDFRLRDSVKSGDTYEISVQDAVFAVSDSEKSLASTSGTLTIQNDKIILED